MTRLLPSYVWFSAILIPQKGTLLIMIEQISVYHTEIERPHFLTFIIFEKHNVS